MAEMSDLMKRLRDYKLLGGVSINEITEEAADEIERLEELSEAQDEAQDVLENSAAKWRERAEAAEARVKVLEDVLEQDRTTVADGISAIKKALAAREWLRLGRGSFEWDDDRWKDEFGAAYDEILEAIEPLRRVASNWQDCPEKHSEIMKARQALAQEQDNG
jgi:hypothetical protein